MVFHKLDMSCDELDEEESVFEPVTENTNVGPFSSIIDMTSLASLVYIERERRLSLLSSGGEFGDDDDNTRLTLAYERLHTIPKTLLDRFGATLQILDISHNKITNLDFLSNFKSLTSLIADNNLINANTTLPPMPNLELLWLNHCKIESLFPWIRKLQQSCPGLKHICLMGNQAAPSYLNGGTFYEYLQYRLFVISLFPNLTHLDDRSVTADQKTEAKRLYKRPLLERLMNFTSSDNPAGLCIQNSAMGKWRSLHQKMSILFENNPTLTTNTRRNLLV